MVVIIHKAVVVYVYFINSASFAEYFQEFLFVLVLSVDFTSGYSTVDYVMKSCEV